MSPLFCITGLLWDKELPCSVTWKSVISSCGNILVAESQCLLKYESSSLLLKASDHLPPARFLIWDNQEAQLRETLPTGRRQRKQLPNPAAAAPSLLIRLPARVWEAVENVFLRPSRGQSPSVGLGRTIETIFKGLGWLRSRVRLEKQCYTATHSFLRQLFIWPSQSGK